jgi:imidazoleglycerol-phosphate dehydratase
MRTATIRRDTLETKITLSVNLDQAGPSGIQTGCGFLDHMLTLFAFHAGVTLTVQCAGDTRVDDHHTVEDVAIVLGEAFDSALDDRCGIERYGHEILPMDEALVLCALDFSGRAFARCALALETEKIGEFDAQLVDEFFWGFARAARATVHLQKLDGHNSHHIAEAAFKAFARSVKTAIRVAGGGVPSSKGMLA